MAVYLTVISGTNFIGSNLTDATFENATLNSTNFTKANLSKVYWRNVKGLKSALIQEPYFKSRNLRKLLTTGQGEEIEFDENSKLTNLNLNNTNLRNAKFIGTDLHNTSFENADLTGAIFIRAELNGVNFKYAILHDACIKMDCNITKNTIFYQAECNKIFIECKLEDEKDKKEKKYKKQVPIKFTNQKEFISYIKDFANILNFPHPSDRFTEVVVVKVISGLSKDYKEYFNIVGHEIKGKNIILRIRIPDSVNPQDVRNEYNPRYNQTLGLFRTDSNFSLSEDEKEKAAELKKYIDFSKSPYQNRYITYTIIIMNFDRSRKNEFNNSPVSIAGDNAFNLGDITNSDLSNKDLSNKIDRMPSDSDDKIREIKDLLKKLLEAIDKSDLSNEEKQESLEQVSVIAEAAPNYQDGAIQKKAKKAIGFLRVIADNVEPASRLAKDFYELLSTIHNFFR